MRVIKEKTAIAAVSELRTHLEEILDQLQETSVVLEKRNRPVAVLSDPKRFEAMEEALETATEVLLAFEAKERLGSTPRSAYVPLEQVKKRLK